MKRATLTVGFTLIEMAIVLVVIGLILSGGLLAVSPILQSSKVSETNSRMDRIEQALILHAIRFSCLPCPAPNVNSYTGTDPGQASDTGGAYNNTTGGNSAGCANSTCTNTHGIVPWVNLGLSEADVIDGFGYRIDYALTNATTSPGDLQRANGAIRDGKSYPTGSLVVNNTAGTQITDKAAYVLISHGPDHSLGFAIGTGTQSINPTNSTNEKLNDGTGANYVQGSPISTSDTNHFDDIVRWRTGAMIAQLCGAGACGNPSN